MYAQKFASRLYLRPTSAYTLRRHHATVALHNSLYSFLLPSPLRVAPFLGFGVLLFRRYYPAILYRSNVIPRFLLSFSSLPITLLLSYPPPPPSSLINPAETSFLPFLPLFLFFREIPSHLSFCTYYTMHKSRLGGEGGVALPEMHFSYYNPMLLLPVPRRIYFPPPPIFPVHFPSVATS